ncbi:MAG: Uma2 family endonuclease [Chloroflexota bacterium]|nr:Uma2 family endonuclease [Chloroflexota bacterium]
MITDPQGQNIGKMSAASYLILDDNSTNAHYEYLDGQVYAMAGGTSDYDYITGNMYIKLREHLGNKAPCRAYTSDKRVKLAEQYYVYPAGVVSCDIAIPVASLYEGLSIPKEEGD